MAGPFVVTTDYRGDDRWDSRALCLPSPEGDAGPVEQLRHCCRVLWAAPTARRGDTPMLLSSSSGRRHPDLVAAAVLGLVPRRAPRIALMGCMWEPDQGPAGWVQRLLVRLADRVVLLYAVQSTDELTSFPETWAVAPDKLRYTPFYATIVDAVAAPAEETYVFAGGNSHREYGSLLVAARALPEVPFVLASNLLEGAPELPPNVRAGPLPRADFDRLLLGAAAVVVPLRRTLRRAAGQQTYLNAMLAGVPVVVADSPGVRDHVHDGKTGLVVDGSPAAYVRALRHLLDPEQAGAVASMRRAAAADVARRFSYGCHLEALLRVVDELPRSGRDRQADPLPN